MIDFVMTEIEVLGVKILEPMTSFTDLITGSVCYIIFFLLNKEEVKEPAYRYLKFYFLFIGTATLWGAIFSHAFLYLVTFSWKAVGWSSSAVGMYLIENGALLNYKRHHPETKLGFLKYVFALQLLIFFLLILNPGTRVFTVTNSNIAIGMILFVFPLFLMTYLKTKSRGNKMILYFFFASLIPGLTFNTKLTLHDFFNYHDISHILMALCMVLLYFGVKQLGKEYELA